MRYPGVSIRDLKQLIVNEAEILATVLNRDVDVVSMHRPSKEVLEADMQITGMINSYGKTFFNGFKYMSDSRRRWREPVEEIISSKRFDRLHLLTHAFWYNEGEIDIHDSIYQFVNCANHDRFGYFMENITDLTSIMKADEIQGLV